MAQAKKRIGALLAAVSLLLLGLASLLLLLAPGMLLKPLANAVLARQGWQIEEIQGLTFTGDQSRVALLQLRQRENQYELENLELNYSLSGLRQGRLQSVRLEQIAVLQSGDPPPPRRGERSLLAYLHDLRQLPLPRLQISRVVFNREQVLDNLQLTPLQDGAELTVNLAGFGLQLSAHWPSQETVRGSLALKQAGEVLMDTRYALQLAPEMLSWESQSRLHLDILQGLPFMDTLLQRASLPKMQVSNQVLQASLQAKLEDIWEAPAVSSFSLHLSDPAQPDMQIQVQPGFTLGIALPLSLSGSLAPHTSGLQLTSSELSSEVSLSYPLLQGRGQVVLQDFTLNCTSRQDCIAQQHWQVQGAGLQSGQYRLGQMSLQGALQLQLQEDALTLQVAEDLHLQLSRFRPAGESAFSLGELSLQSDSALHGRFSRDSQTLRLDLAQAQLQLNALATPFSQSLVDLSLRNLALQSGSSGLQASASFASTLLQPGLTGITLSRPALQGEFGLQQQRLVLETTLTLNNQPLLHTELQHDLAQSQGQAELRLPEYAFSRLTPLSALLPELPVDADLLSGTLAAQAELAWRASDPGGWQIQGPLSLQVQNLGGHYQQVVFAGLDTSLQARLESGQDVFMPASAMASIRTLEIGIPIEDIQWRYRLDSAEGLLEVRDFTAQLLGGRLAVAHFDYRQGRAENPLLLELSGLQLAEIVGLVDTPGLMVEGAIGGRLPLSLSSGSGILLKQGNISAQPGGGRIRYVPPATAGNSNATLRLVYDALANFRYDSLQAELDYAQNGDLLVALALQGQNPDLHEGQRINLNVNITDNIPTLLKSLQASRAITEVLEQHLRQR